MERRTAVIYLFCAALCWSLGGVLIKGVMWHPMAISGVRSFIAAALILLVFGRPRFTWSVPQLGGALTYAATAILFVVSTKLTTAANAILLQYTAPAFAALFGIWYLGERPRRSDWITLVVVMGGMVLFFLDRLTLAGLWGNIAALVSGFTFAWMALFMRRQKDTSPMESVLLGNLLAGLAGIPFMTGDLPDPAGWLRLAALGVVQLGMAYVFFTKAIRHVTAVESLLIPTIEPVLNPIWTLLFIGEIPGPLALCGGAVIIGAVLARGIVPLLRYRASG
ncbi:DMT family transporter [Geomobilimonas luticola]|uniref:EamA family transporter n=1 Tax=Geomobilimonas luticola TaxID=1114878 RepID=A0ABS5SDR0_9BACT|nr:EamA family transporter [Geomobilimonas luticola]MBT0653488.1 EamA family transporter [Geomobilimonas luticola]